MSNGWCYALRTLFFAVAGPIIGCLLVFLSFRLAFGDSFQGIGAALSDPKFRDMIAASYLVGAVPALVTGWAVAHAARRKRSLAGLCLDAAVIGLFASLLWLTALFLLVKGMADALGESAPLLTAAGAAGLLAAPICTLLTSGLRPKPDIGVETAS